jgi:hypothetical protein
MRKQGQGELGWEKGDGKRVGLDRGDREGGDGERGKGVWWLHIDAFACPAAWQLEGDWPGQGYWGRMRWGLREDKRRGEEASGGSLHRGHHA